MLFGSCYIDASGWWCMNTTLRDTHANIFTWQPILNAGFMYPESHNEYWRTTDPDDIVYLTDRWCALRDIYTYRSNIDDLTTPSTNTPSSIGKLQTDDACRERVGWCRIYFCIDEPYSYKITVTIKSESFLSFSSEFRWWICHNTTREIWYSVIPSNWILPWSY